jgi:PAS domain S-box-containing protein
VAPALIAFNSNMSTSGVGQRPAEKGWLGLLPLLPPPLWIGQLVALACILVATALLLLLPRGVGGELPFITLLPAILLAAVWGGYVAGLTATFASGAIGAAFFIQTHPHRPLDRYAWVVVTCVIAGGLLALVGGRLARTVRALARSERGLRSLIDASSQVVIRLDAPGERMAPNPRWRRLTGLTDERKPGGWRAALHPEDAAKAPSPLSGELQLEVRLKQATGDYRWNRLTLAPLTEGGAVVEWLGAVEDIHARKSGEALSHTLAHELAHRAKNGLAVVQAIISQSARQATSVEELEKKVIARLDAMGAAQDAVSGVTNDHASLLTLVDKTLSPFDLTRFQVRQAVPLSLRRDLAVTLGLMLYELATNAMKYGALSVPGGQVTITAGAGAGELSQITWSETGGPPVIPNNKVGFGARLIQVGLSSFGGRGELTMSPSGVVCVLSFKT